MTKYYISNDIRFLTGVQEGATVPVSGTHMKLSKAKAFVKDHPHYSYYKARSSSKKNDYVICTPIKLLSKEGKTTDSFSSARVFSSVEDAYRYMDTVRSSLDESLCVVIDEKFKRENRPSYTKQSVEPLEVFRYANMDSSERITFPIAVKEEIYRRCDGICVICGKTIPKHQPYTIDHIIPLSRGGTNAPENLRIAHEDCNKLKNNFMDNELHKNVSNVFCNAVAQNPDSIQTVMFLRSFVRGINRKYGYTRS